MAEDTKPAVLHIFGQSNEHDDAYIIGNRDGLQALLFAVQRALVDLDGQSKAMVQDGEGFGIKVMLLDQDWQSDAFKSLAVPYTSKYAQEKREDNITWPDILWETRHNV